MANTVKIPAETWIDAARKSLIADGLAGVKVDRLAKQLGVTRGGFYHHFKSHQDLLDQLIKYWATSNDLMPDVDKVQTPAEALTAFEAWMMHVISQKTFSPAFEMAVREWARIDPQVNRIVDRVDIERVERMCVFFRALGCEEDEANIRARVLYFHQIGYYSLGYHKRQSKEERMRNAPIYMRILCGKHYIEAAENAARKWA